MVWLTSSHYCPYPHGGKIVCTLGIAISVDGLRRQPEMKLSSRQLDVLCLPVQAKSTSEIADELHLAPDTVRNRGSALMFLA